MPFAFTLPTTSYIDLTVSYTCPSHPSLPFVATTKRGILRNVLKAHKRLPATSQRADLNNIHTAVTEYLSYILALESGLQRGQVTGERVVVEETQHLCCEWRTKLKGRGPGYREISKIKLQGLDQEIHYVASVQALTHYLQARAQLQTVCSNTSGKASSDERRSTIINAAAKSLLQANAIFNYLSQHTSLQTRNDTIADISQSAFAALASLTLAEATLATVLKDDLYPAIAAQNRDTSDKDWMVKPPDIPQSRVRVMSHLCLSAAEHAETSLARMSGRSMKMIDGLPEYLSNLKRTARARASRFLGIDAEANDKVGDAIAWLHLAHDELGLLPIKAGSKYENKGLNKWRSDRADKHEMKKTSSGGDWGSDAGKMEEARVVEMLLAKWNKLNDTVSFQRVPTAEHIMATMPSGRNLYSHQVATLANLDTSTLTRLRAPPESLSVPSVGNNGSSSEEEQRTEPQYY